MENHQLVLGNARLNISEAEIKVTCDIEKWEVRFSVSQASFLCVRLSCRLRAACDFDKRSLAGNNRHISVWRNLFILSLCALSPNFLCLRLLES